MNYKNENVEFLQSKDIQKTKSIKKNGILIYQEAKTKLQISNSGKIYKQKVLSYIPIIGPLFSSVYANLCVGKTRCLRMEDSKKFKSAGRNVNLFAFLLWPIIFLGLWTLFQYLFMDFAWGGTAGAYIAMWNNVIDTWKNFLNLIQGGTIQVTDPNGVVTNMVVAANNNYIGLFIGSLFTGLFDIMVQPLKYAVDATGMIIQGIPLDKLNPNAVVPNNILFIASIFVLTWLNPVNIVNSFILNARKRRFTVVLEDTSVYQYRNR